MEMIANPILLQMTGVLLLTTSCLGLVVSIVAWMANMGHPRSSGFSLSVLPWVAGAAFAGALLLLGGS